MPAEEGRIRACPSSSKTESDSLKAPANFGKPEIDTSFCKYLTRIPNPEIKNLTLRLLPIPKGIKGHFEPILLMSLFTFKSRFILCQCGGRGRPE
jgi:hypothetical protein